MIVAQSLARKRPSQLCICQSASFWQSLQSRCSLAHLAPSPCFQACLSSRLWFPQPETSLGTVRRSNIICWSLLRNWIQVLFLRVCSPGLVSSETRGTLLKPHARLRLLAYTRGVSPLSFLPFRGTPTEHRGFGCPLVGFRSRPHAGPGEADRERGRCGGHGGLHHGGARRRRRGGGGGLATGVTSQTWVTNQGVTPAAGLLILHQMWVGSSTRFRL